jgi:hypothetical protein
LCRATGAPDESPAGDDAGRPAARGEAGLWDVCQNVQASRSQPEEFAVASTEVERSSGVDVADVPSANWGWSKINYRNWHITGLLIIGLLVAFLDGNHVGKVEDLWVIGFALLGAFLLVRDWWGRRRGWLR